MGLGSDTYRTVSDPDAVITQLGVKNRPDGNLELHFELQNNPSFLFFRVSPLTHRRRKKDAVEFVFLNRESRFKMGMNTLILDPESADPVVRKLIGKLDGRQYVLLTAGYSRRPDQWGYGASTTFTTTDRFTRPALKQE
jgi:hypothetical protein